MSEKERQGIGNAPLPVEPHRKGTGFAKVRQLFFDRCGPDGLLCITTEQIGAAVGIKKSAVHAHLQSLKKAGTIRKAGRSLYVLNRTGSGWETEIREKTCEREAENEAMRQGPTGWEAEEKRMGSGNSGCKKDIQERKEEKEKKKHVDLLGNWVDPKSKDFQEAKRKATALFNKHRAGVKRGGTSPVLINRFVAGFLLKIPLVDFEELEEQLIQAEEEYLAFESFRGYGQQSGIRKPFVRIASYLKKCFEADGWTWTKLKSPFENRLKKAHAIRVMTPTFPEITNDLPADTEHATAEPNPIEAVTGMPTLSHNTADSPPADSGLPRFTDDRMERRFGKKWRKKEAPDHAGDPFGSPTAGTTSAAALREILGTWDRECPVEKKRLPGRSPPTSITRSE